MIKKIKQNVYFASKYFCFYVFIYISFYIFIKIEGIVWILNYLYIKRPGYFSDKPGTVLCEPCPFGYY